jgi:predicted O-methyltransferase YrrM
MDNRTANVIRACEEFIQDRDDALALPREAAEFVHTLALATGAKRAIEIGTSYGYSGLWIGSAVKENTGTLITIDVDPRKSDTAAAYFADAGLTDAVRCVTGRALEVISRLEPDGQRFDLVLNDADKENCQAYVEALLPRLADGAVVLTDNTITHERQLAGFVSWARADPRLRSVHLPIGNGMEMSVKRPSGPGASLA